MQRVDLRLRRWNTLDANAAERVVAAELPARRSRLATPMGRGSRPTKRWKHDRQRKKKQRQKRRLTPDAPPARARSGRASA
jgi:hypothetical protein